MAIGWTRYESIGVGVLLACGSAAFGLGVQPLLEARQTEQARAVELRASDAESDELERLAERFQARLAEAERFDDAAGQALGNPSLRNDQTAWILETAQRFRVRVDRLRPESVEGPAGARRAPLTLIGAAEAQDVAEFLGVLRAERPALLLRRLELEAQSTAQSTVEPNAENTDSGEVRVVLDLDWRVHSEGEGAIP